MIIYATSGYAAEVVGIAQSVGHRVTAIWGSDGARLAADRLAIPFHEVDQDHDVPPHGDVVIALGDNERRGSLHKRLAETGRTAVTLVHPDTTIGPAVDLGAGTVVSPGVRITANLRVGSGALVHTGAVLSHDDVLGDFVTISPAVTLCGGVTVGDRAWIAAGATVLPGVTIGEDAIVGAGAMVHRDVAPGTTVAGVPAKQLG